MDSALMAGSRWKQLHRTDRGLRSERSFFMWKGRKDMNLVEKLLKIDRDEFNAKKTKEILSRVLSETFGEKTMITLQSVGPQEILDLSASGLDEEGRPIVIKTLQTNSMIVAAAVTDPNLKDADLMKHLGAATPAMAALKLFKGEVNNIAAEVNRMAGFNMEDVDFDEEIKN